MSSVRKYVCYSFNNSVVKVLLLGSEFRIYFRESEAKLACEWFGISQISENTKGNTFNKKIHYVAFKRGKIVSNWE